MAKGAVRDSVSESKYKVKTERVRDEFRRLPENSDIYKDYLENPGSNLQGKIRAETFRKQKLTPLAVYKDTRFKQPDCYFQSDHWEL